MQDKAATEALIRAFCKNKGGSAALVIPPWAVTLEISGAYAVPEGEEQNPSLASRGERQVTQVTRRPASAACARAHNIDGVNSRRQLAHGRIARESEGAKRSRILRKHARPVTAMGESALAYSAKPGKVGGTATEAARVCQRQAWWPSECILDALRQRSRASGLSNAKHIRPKSRTRDFSEFGCTGPRRDVQTPEVLAKELEILLRLESRLDNVISSSSRCC